jgi:hypothetical protein
MFDHPQSSVSRSTDGMRARLRAIGLSSETIAWKVRFFVATADKEPAILSQLIERHRIVDVARRT